MGILEQALELAFKGIPVFPCGKKKLPVISKKLGGKGFYDATCDENEVRRLFKLAPRATLVGTPTGSVTGFDVLDLDYRNGAGKWELDNAHRLPRTRTHITQSGGRHLLFKHSPGVRNSASKTELAPGVDVRGDGGYVIYPPSLGYLVHDDTEIAPWPAWLLELVLKRDPPKTERPPSSEITPLSNKRAEGFVKSILSKISNSPDGAKHDTLLNCAKLIGGIAEAAGLSDGDAVQRLVGALPQSVEDWESARKTAEYGIKWGKERPLELEDRPRYRHPQDTETPEPPDWLDAETGELSIEANDVPFGQLNGHNSNHTPPPIEDPRRPTISVMAGQRHIAADHGIAALMGAKVEFYQRNRHIVRSAIAKAKTSDGSVIEIANIVPVIAPILGRELGRCAEWQRFDKEGVPHRIDPPKEIVDQILAMSGEWPFLPLTGLISTPTMRPDGTILSKPGYDISTGLVLVTPPQMPSIPDHPMREDALVALGHLNDLLYEFPFVDLPSKSVALSMILTVVLRGALLPAVPMHVASAPAPGTGKSYLADIASVVGTGERCAVIANSPNPEETEKRLIGAALSGQQIIAIDNVSEMMSGDFLNQVTERPILQLRPLGTSETQRIANSFTVFANGNNLSAPADLVRRTLLCRLDSNEENPEERTFTNDPVKMVMADRGKYVAACLIIGRAYVIAGKPDKKNLPSFDPWSTLVRSSLIWLDCADPCKSMDMARAEDPLRAAKAALFQAWEKELSLGDPGMTTAQMIEHTEDRDEHGFFRPLFREACLVIAAERNGVTVSPRRLGKWLSSVNNNKVGDLKLTVNRQDAARPRWILTNDSL